MNLKGSGILKSPPPLGIQVFKGYKNVALTRLTARFIAHHPISHEFQGIVRSTYGIQVLGQHTDFCRVHYIESYSKLRPI